LTGLTARRSLRAAPPPTELPKAAPGWHTGVMGDGHAGLDRGRVKGCGESGAAGWWLAAGVLVLVAPFGLADAAGRRQVQERMTARTF